MKLIALFVVLMSTAVQAQDVADFGGTGCRLVPVAGETHVAEIRCHNAQTAGPWYDEATLSIKDMRVDLTIMHGPGDVADSFTFLVPDGYIAIPEALMLDEHTSGVVLIYPLLLG